MTVKCSKCGWEGPKNDPRGCREGINCPLFAPTSERIDHPSHYGGKDNLYEVIKVLRAWLTTEEFEGFLKGNVIKYEARARMKAGTEDYQKALWYQNYLVNWLRERGR